MNIDRHVELHGCREEAVIARMIEEAAFGHAVDQRADETQFLHSPPELDRRGVGRRQRQIGEAGKAVGMTCDLLRQVIVRFTRQRDTVGPGKEIGPGTCDRKHLHGDARRIHRFKPALADLRQQFHRIGRARSDLSRPKAAAVSGVLRNAFGKLGYREMFFEGDDTHK